MREEPSDGFSAFRSKPPEPGSTTKEHPCAQMAAPSVPSVGSGYGAGWEQEVTEATETKYRVSPVSPVSQVSNVFPVFPALPLGPVARIFRALRESSGPPPPFRAFRGFRGGPGFSPADFQGSQREINPAIGSPACALHPRDARPRQSHRFPRGRPHGRAAVRGDGGVSPVRPSSWPKNHTSRASASPKAGKTHTCFGPRPGGTSPRSRTIAG